MKEGNPDRVIKIGKHLEGDLRQQIISRRGIKADPSQIKAIMDSRDPTTWKELQTWTGCIATPLRSIPQSSKRRALFSEVIENDSKQSKINWTEQCEKKLFSQFYIEYKLRTAMKAQALSDIVVEGHFDKSDHLHLDVDKNQSRSWTLYVDSSSASNRRGEGIILISPEGPKVQQASTFAFQTTNNEVEYKALIAVMNPTLGLEANVIDISSDSQLMVKQILQEFKINNDRIALYLQKAQTLLSRFVPWKITNIDGSKNQWADTLSKLASSSIPTSGEPVHVEKLITPTVDFPTVNAISLKPDGTAPWEYKILKAVPPGNL